MRLLQVLNVLHVFTCPLTVAGEHHSVTVRIGTAPILTICFRCLLHPHWLDLNHRHSGAIAEWCHHLLLRRHACRGRAA